MRLITLGQAREHVKSDGDDDALLTTLCNSAEAACARLANRGLFATTSELTAAIATIPTVMAAAYATYDAALIVAQGETDPRMVAIRTASAQKTLDNATLRCDAIRNGLALDAADAAGLPSGDDVIAAILLTVGHFYRNREGVVTGQGAAAVEVPMSARHIMDLCRWIGPL